MSLLIGHVKGYGEELNMYELINDKFKINTDLNYYWTIQDIIDEKIKTIYELQEELFKKITEHIIKENKIRKEYKTKKIIDTTKVNNYYWSIL